MRRVTLALTVLMLAGCAPTEDGLESQAQFACDDFAAGYGAAQTTQARVDLADEVNRWASDSRVDGIRDDAAGLARTADGADTAWQLSADTFAQTCMDAGWPDS